MQKETTIFAHYYRQEFDLRAVRQEFSEIAPFRQERRSLTYRISENHYLTFYSFGVVTSFGEGADEDYYFDRLAGLHEDMGASRGNRFLDDLTVTVGTGEADAIGFNVVKLRDDSADKLLIISHVLAQSVAIDYLESRIGHYLREFDRMNASLARRGRVEASTKEVMKMIGSAGSMVNYAIAKLSLLDSPDITWEDKEAETLFLGLQRMYDLDDRFESLRVKLDFIQGNSETMLDVLNSRRSEWLEIIIIVLIFVEIIMGLADLW